MNRDSPSRLSVEIFEPCQSTWALIESQTIEEERTEIKKLIGSSLIEETVDLHGEVNTLLEIWRDFREETNKQEKGSSLPEPPNVRENLVKQIQLFVKLIQDKAARERSDARGTLSPHQYEIVSNICETKDQHSVLPERPQTACSARDGRETPLRPSSSQSGGSCSSRSSDYFSDNQEIKSSEEIEKLASIIREDLEEERTGLYRDIEFLQQCLMDESTFQESVSNQNEPSLKELKDIGLKLEKELLIVDPIPKGNTNKYVPHQQFQENHKVNRTKQIHPSEAYPRRLLPSPPSSAPTSKNRTSVIQRKHLTTKVVQFTSDEQLAANHNKMQSDESHQLSHSETSESIPARKKIATVTATTAPVIAPCVVSSMGSNSRKLRQVVLNSRENQT